MNLFKNKKSQKKSVTVEAKVVTSPTLLPMPVIGIEFKIKIV